MDNKRVLGVDNGEVTDINEVKAIGDSFDGGNASLDTDDVLDTGNEAKTGIIAVIDSTNDKSAVFSIHSAAGTPTLTKLAGDTAIDTTKDAASKINVYFEGGKLVVQSKLAAAADVSVKSIG